LRRGLIERENCQLCGSDQDLQMHHEDYSKPYEIKWLCRKCHYKHHNTPTTMIEQQWRKEYKRLYIENFARKYPIAYKEQGPPEMKWPVVSKANGLTMAIIRFLTRKGHYANRIGTQGQAQVQKIPRFNIHSQQMQYFEKVKWTKGNTKRGTPDITAIIGGKAVWIEVKIGKDRMSDAQKEQQASIETAGGIYYIATEMQLFYEWYNATFGDSTSDR